MSTYIERPARTPEELYNLSLHATLKSSKNTQIQAPESVFRHQLLEASTFRKGITPNDISEYLNIKNYIKVGENYEKDFQNLLDEKIPDLALHMVFTGQIQIKHYRPKDPNKIDGYGKYLFYSYKDGVDANCYQLFAFNSSQWEALAKGQKTPEHPHIAPCTSTVIAGIMQETKGVLVPDPHSDQQVVEIFDTQKRGIGSTAGFNENQLNIVHSLENIGFDNHIDVRLPVFKDLENPLKINLTEAKMAITLHHYRDMDGVGYETPQATSLRKGTEAYIGKANVAGFYQRAKS